MEKDKVTIIITTYKRPVEIVKRAIMSVINQSYKNIELFVINDCPEDKKLSKQIGKMIIDIGNDKIEYIVEDKNHGACYARNLGIKRATGKYIALLDDDDEWINTKIEKQVNAFQNHKKENIGIVYNPYFNVNIDSKEKKKIVLCKKSGNILNEMLIKNCIGGCSMPLIKKEVFEKCGLFDEQFPALQDYDMWVRITSVYNAFFLNEPLTIRYLQDDSISNDFTKKDKGFSLFMKKHQNLYKKKPRIYNISLNRTAKAYIQRGELSKGKAVWKEAISIKRISIYNVYYPLKGLLKLLLLRIKKGSASK